MGTESHTHEEPTETVPGFDLGHNALLDGVQYPMFALDAEKRVVAWNDALAAFTGTPREEILGQTGASTAFYQDGRRAETLRVGAFCPPRIGRLDEDADEPVEGSDHEQHDQQRRDDRDHRRKLLAFEPEFVF